MNPKLAAALLLATLTLVVATPLATADHDPLHKEGRIYGPGILLEHCDYDVDPDESPKGYHDCQWQQ